MDINAVNHSNKKLDISVDSNKLTAYVYIAYSTQALAKEGNDNAASEKYTFRDLEEALKAKGIVYGILYENFKKALNGNSEVLIAQGTLPKKPIDDTIEYLFPTKEERKLTEKDSRIDFLDTGSIFFVKEGDLLARIIDGKDGTPGRDVFGKIIPASRRIRARLRKGPNCEYTPDRMAVISKISGMPCLKKDIITVFNTYSLNSDVDCRTGNVVFDGNILINGNIKEGMKVRSRGNITVTQNVDSSELQADGDICIMKNLICSNIKAGASKVSENMAIKHLRDITSFFSDFGNALDTFLRCTSVSESTSMKAIINVILQMKFRDVKKALNASVDYFKNTEVDSNLTGLFTDSFKLFNLLEAGALTDMEPISKQILINTDYIEGFESIYSSSNAVVSSCQNSTIYATNDVVISGKGCYNTSIITKDNVSFTGYPGIFRGGSICAGRNISVKELGSAAEVSTVIRTSREGTVTAEKVFPNVTIYFDNLVYKVEDSYKNFKAYIENREIFIQKQML